MEPPCALVPPLRAIQCDEVVQTAEVEMLSAAQGRLPANYFAQMLEFGAGRISLGGHRGLGANEWAAHGPLSHYNSQKFRENTVSSFLAAAQAGATFIEFDVQVTADGVPVIFHDNYLIFGDAASPTSSMVKHLSVADFKGLAPINSSSDLTSLDLASDDDAMSSVNGSILGSSPLGGSPLGGSPRAVKRLLRKHRTDTPAVPFEPSLHPWEVHTEDNFPTLAEVFAKLPPNVAFDIEVKMTTPCDVDRTPAEEVERVVSATLAAVEAAHGEEGPAPRRAVMFSSFDPEVCLELKLRQPEIPVMFLSGGGAYPHVDLRRTSVSAALQFAAESRLEGVIFESFVLEQHPLAVAQARQLGLQVMTYGTRNDDPEWVRQQEELGVHGVIVDDVQRAAEAFSLMPAAAAAVAAPALVAR